MEQNLIINGTRRECKAGFKPVSQSESAFNINTNKLVT